MLLTTQLTESNHREGCLMPMDRFTIKKLKADKQLVLPSKLFLKVKYLLAGTFDKFKARLAGGGHRQNYDDYESTSLPAVATSSVPMVAARSAKRGNSRMTTDVSSAYPHGQRHADGLLFVGPSSDYAHRGESQRLEPIRARG